ncbi:MAG: flavin reductase family protein [Gammaproteobacteria bacterium]|jgi:flavin reductase (DIM6/NTAB) family NADH-FMN oxidoreductase RutF|nr:flavin reductase family protein [Gammaproteobacteria bacterium]MDP6165779.1 flavin reductase family protein [Gammaproteobacteria bacterium]
MSQQDAHINWHSFDPAIGHGLKHDPMKAIVAPRPIAWIASVNRVGQHNLAPYSFFNLVSASPPLLIFSSDGSKDSLRNIKETGEFTVNLVTQDNVASMNQSSAFVAPEVDEFELAQVPWLASDVVLARRVASSPVNMECKLVEVKLLQDIHGQPCNASMVIGQIVRVHIHQHCLQDGLFSIVKAGTVARAGYASDYVAVDRVQELVRPG